MTTLKLTTGEWLGVTVKEGARELIIANGKLFYLTPESDKSKHIDLHPGSSLPFPCVVGEMTEDMAGQVVEYCDYRQQPMEFIESNEGYPVYDNGRDDDGTWLYITHDLTASLLSLCRANGLNPSTTILIKVNN